ncbi:MAG: sel1 repeat family protein [Proteobacteria bacterium]|nr:sel1 repeat family protein [Pseudomonadota bacterium]
MVIAAVIATFAVVFAAGLLFGFAFHGAPNAPVATAISATPTPADLIWPDLLEPGAVSPRGQSSAGVASDQAFKLADARLHGIDGQTDADEARFWLRVGIADALADDRLRWALTQLGTLYARPQASPADFAAARAVWELAAAKKDPVALCFLAKLEEGGPGVPSNKATALRLYKQAKDAGGCPLSDQAIERLSR